MPSDAPVPPSAAEPRRTRLGEILVENGAITTNQLERALAEQATMKLPLGQILLKLDYVTDETMRQALGLQLNVPYLDLENVMIDRGLARVINPMFAKRHALLPVATVGRTLTIAMDDPTATSVVEDLNRLTGFSVTVVTSSSRAIQRAFRRLYDDVPDLVEHARGDAESSAPHDQMVGASEPAAAASLAGDLDGLTRSLVVAALDRGARFLHVHAAAPDQGIRLRIGGRLVPLPPGVLPAGADGRAREIAARLAAIGRLDRGGTARHGRAEVVVDRRGRPGAVGLDISMVAGPAGDSVVVGLIDRQAEPRVLGDLGLSALVVAGLESRLSRREGVIVVAGPDAALTAETLHACARRAARTDDAVATVEDPVAYVRPGWAQSDVGRVPGGTFAEHLRALLRHDVDVLLVGDLGDAGVAALAFRAAASGRLVLGGLAGGASAVDVASLIADLGVPSSALGRGLAGVLHRPAAAGGDAPATTAPRAELWLTDGRDADLLVERAPLAALRESARRTTVV